MSLQARKDFAISPYEAAGAGIAMMQKTPFVYLSFGTDVSSASSFIFIFFYKLLSIWEHLE